VIDLRGFEIELETPALDGDDDSRRILTPAASRYFASVASIRLSRTSNLVTTETS